MHMRKSLWRMRIKNLLCFELNPIMEILQDHYDHPDYMKDVFYIAENIPGKGVSQEQFQISYLGCKCEFNIMIIKA